MVGYSRDLSKATIITTMIVNGVPQTAIEISEGVRKHVFGENLARIEQQWLASEINEVIDKVSSNPRTNEDDINLFFKNF